MQHRWILICLAFALFPCSVAAQRPPERTAPQAAGVRLGLATLPAPLSLSFELAGPEDLLFSRVPFRDWVADWTRDLDRRLEADRGTLLARRFAPDPQVVPAASPAAAPPLGEAPPREPPDLLGGTLGQYADLGMRITGMGELGGSWQRYKPCDPGLYLNCNPGLFPQLSPDVEFGVQVSGTISDRIHVNVDYDQRREDFSASNNINVYYQGRPGEIVQRVEVGDVSLRLPSSRYLTRGVPAGNFGFTAIGQLGPLNVRTVFAQQRGDLSTREFRLAGGGTEGLVQDEHIVLDDADYVRGQFFFLFDPARLPGAPHVDVLKLQPGDAPTDVRPDSDGTLQLYRDERISTSSAQQAQLGLFLADAVSEGRELTHTGLFRRLVPDEDYVVHSSGAWVVLRSPLRPDEALAIAYVTESGDTIGDVEAERAPAGITPELRLLRSPAASHQPGGPTWPLELHNVYRVTAGGSVELSSLDVRISLGDAAAGLTFKDGPTGQVPFLRLFGLDDDAPADVVDEANLFQPAREGLGAPTGTPPPVGGTFVVFPTLEPFKRPPPVPAAGLDATEAAQLLGTDANPAIYDQPDPVTRESSSRFRITFRYRVRVEGMVSTFNLGQFGIREGTERLTIGDRALARDVDYTIDYELGIVTLADAASLFGANPDAEIRATWEQRSLFEVAPTSVFGATATYSLGEVGALNFVGIYQSEKTLYTRPQLGVEPGSIFLGGASANLRFEGGGVDRLLANIPGLRLSDGSTSTVTLDGEVALSAPNPNRSGTAWLDDFEGSDEIALDLKRQQWRLGARPNTTEGADGTLPEPAVDNAARLVWQHDISQGGSVAGSLLPRRDIDRQINVAGNALPEPAMWLSFGEPGLVPGERVWRSITTVLSTTGRDMTRSEYLEFYVNARDDRPLALVLDIGTVGEDAFYIAPDGATNGSYPDGRAWGLGVLDAEARLAEREIWGPDRDALGLWDQSCEADPLTAYPLGDERANCTRGNGIPDSEDLDGNGVLQADDGALFRYVVTLDRLSPWLVRDTAATGTPFRLYRIPLRSGVPVNGASDATWRFVKHLRVTVAGEPADQRTLVLARMRLIGSRWTKRDVYGVLSGMLEDRPGAGASGTDVRVGPVSRVTDGAVYSSPPGVIDQLQDPTAQFGGAGIEFNEKALRIGYSNLLPDERAEIYLRYPQQPRNFMTYRQLRLWALPRTGRWGTSDGERLLIKVGTDARNYYLFQTPLRPATGERAATSADWSPEVVIEFSRWFELKAEAERRLLERGAGTTIDTVWSADSTYAVVLEDRARAPNLAAVREIVFAIYNAGGAAADGEVWLNELRLDGALTDPGGAGNLTLALSNEFLSASIGYANRGSLFRQLGETPGYATTGDLAFNARAQLDRFMPESWGFDAPLTVSHATSDVAPGFLEQSDVRAGELPELRDIGASQTRLGLRLTRRATSDDPVGRLLLDPTTLRFGWSRARTSTINARAETSGMDAGIDYRYGFVSRNVGFFPAFVRDALRAVAPAAIEQSDAFSRLLDSRLRWTPDRIGFGVSWFDRDDRAFRFDRILATPLDSAVRPIESPRKGLENSVELGLLPFESLSGSLSLRSARDLLDPNRASTQDRQRYAIASARRTFAGVDVGWERSRTFGTDLAFRPRIADWLRVSWTYSNRYGTDRNPSFLELLIEGEDSTAVLQRRFGTDRQVSRRVDIQPGRLLRAAAGVDPDSAPRGPLLRLGQAFESLSLTWSGGLSSQFERETFEPRFGYRFGLGGLESHRIIGSDTAAQALERQDVRLSSTFALPLRAQLTAGFQHATSDGYAIRGGRRRSETTGWPDLRLSWRQIPLPPFLSGVVSGAAASVGYEHVERENIYGAGAAQRRGTIEDRFPLELSLNFANGFAASYTATLTEGESTDPTGSAEDDRDNHALRLSGSFAAPPFLREKMNQPIQLLLLLTQDQQRQCRLRADPFGLDDCVAYVDARTRSVNFTMDTRLTDMLLGLRLTWTDRASAVGTRAGSSQFQLALFGQFDFTAGRIPEAGFR